MSERQEGNNRISDASDPDFLRCLNAVRLQEEELAMVLAAARNVREVGETDSWTGIITTVRLFNDFPDKAKAIIFRLQALAAMVARDELGDWVTGYGTTMMPTTAQKALLSAAADHPLSYIDGDVSFERESFLERVLELSESQGDRN